MSTESDIERSGERRLELNRQLSETLQESSHPVRKLTPELVLEIRERYEAGGENTSELAREYGVSQTTISEVVRGLLWRHVGGPIRRDRPGSEASDQ